MFTALKRFLWDEAYFAQQARAIIFLLGTLMLTGVIDLGAIESHLGKYGWFAGIFMQAAAVFVHAGERNNGNGKPQVPASP